MRILTLLFSAALVLAGSLGLLAGCTTAATEQRRDDAQRELLQLREDIVKLRAAKDAAEEQATAATATGDSSEVARLTALVGNLASAIAGKEDDLDEVRARKAAIDAEAWEERRQSAGGWLNVVLALTGLGGLGSSLGAAAAAATVNGAKGVS